MPSNPRRFVGYSTIDAAPGTTGTSHYDKDLAIRDLLNTFHTPKGSRVMLPRFGSNIYSYVFEPLTDAARDDIVNDAKDVVASDPRFHLLNVIVDQDDYGITVGLSLIYNPTGMTTSLSVDFQKKNQENT